MYIHVRIKVKQKSESIIQISDLKYEVCVKEEAKQNQANSRMLQILSDYFHTNQIKIVSGHHSPSKLISLEVSE